jgi:hypothetical protein
MRVHLPLDRNNHRNLTMSRRRVLKLYPPRPKARISTDIVARCLASFRKHRDFRSRTSYASRSPRRNPAATPPVISAGRPSLLASRYSLRIHTSQQSTFQSVGKSCCLCLCVRAADNCAGSGANTLDASPTRQTIEFQFRSVEALLPVTRLNKQSFPLIRQWRRALSDVFTPRRARARNSRRWTTRAALRSIFHKYHPLPTPPTPPPCFLLSDRRGSPATAPRRETRHNARAFVPLERHAPRCTSLCIMQGALSLRRDFGRETRQRGRLSSFRDVISLRILLLDGAYCKHDTAGDDM